MKKIIFKILLFVIVFPLLSQNAPDTLWTRVIGGYQGDEGWSILQTEDNGYIIVGATSSYGAGGSEDVWLIKTDSNGDTLWTKTYGGIDGETGYSIQKTNDNGFIIAGITGSFPPGDSNVFLVKTDFNGNEQWNRVYGGNDSDSGWFVQQTNDGGFIIVGNTYSFGLGGSDVWLIKTDENGNESWNQTYGGIGIDYGRSVLQTIDNGFLIIGGTEPFEFGNADVWLIKTDADGDTLWTKTYGGNDIDYGQSVQQTIDDGYILVGTTKSYGHGSWDVYLIKTNANGDTLWTNTFGGIGSESGWDVKQTLDGGFIIVGDTHFFGSGGDDVYVIKTDNLGNEIWFETYGCEDYDSGYSVQQTIDYGYIIAGYTNIGSGAKNIYLIKLESEFKADFTADTTFGYVQMVVDFLDQSDGIPTNWFWDFQNDGIYDSFEQNPTYTYTQPGIYDVKLKISNETQVDSLIKYDYITVELVPPAAPENVQIEISGNDILLNWTEVDTTIFGTPINVDYYLIYHSINPYENFYYLGATQNTTFTHNLVVPFEDKMFYYLKSFVGTRQELEEYVRRPGNR